MAEITAYAYEKIREFAETNWKYIELQDDTNTPIVRLTNTDPRVTIVKDASTIKITITVKGSDVDITAPKTFTKSIVYDKAIGTDAISTEVFTPFTILGDEDTLVVIHTIEIPKVI